MRWLVASKSLVFSASILLGLRGHVVTKAQLPPPSENACDLCNGDQVLSSQEISFLGLTCGELALNVSQFQDDQCPEILADGFDIGSLCCEGRERPNQCEICSIQEDFVPFGEIIIEEIGQTVCTNVQEIASLATSTTTCDSLRSQTRETCCIQASQSNIIGCELRCADGSLPSDPLKQDPVTKNVCADLILQYSEFPNSPNCHEDIAASIGFNGLAFCCSDIDPVQECLNCQIDEELLFPERILFSFEGHSCLEIEESLRYAVGNSACNEILDNSRAESNCLCRPRTGDPTNAPSIGTTEESTDIGSAAAQTTLLLKSKVITLFLPLGIFISFNGLSF